MLNLYELAKIIKESLIIEVRNNSFTIQFKNCDIKEYKSSHIISTCWGCGSSIDEAADDYFSQINKKWLVFNSRQADRREYSTEIYQKKNLEGA